MDGWAEHYFFLISPENIPVSYVRVHTSTYIGVCKSEKLGFHTDVEDPERKSKVTNRLGSWLDAMIMTAYYFYKRPNSTPPSLTHSPPPPLTRLDCIHNPTPTLIGHLSGCPARASIDLYFFIIYFLIL